MINGKAAATVGGREIGVIGPGECVGEMALLDTAPRTATVTATTDMEVFVLEPRSLGDLLDRHPSVAKRMLAAMARRLRAVSNAPGYVDRPARTPAICPDAPTLARTARGARVHPVLFTVGGTVVRSHDFFVGLGVLAALVVFALEVRRRGTWDDRLLVVVTLTLFGGAIGMRAAGLVRHLDPGSNPGLVEGLRYGAKSILGGLTGAYVGALLGKRIAGYSERTGDLFAPAVALGMAVGRIGCLLAEAPGRPTALPWGVHVDPAAEVGYCPGCATGAAMHPSFAYEIAFHLLAFVALRRLRGRDLPRGELLTLYLAGYGTFRFLVEFTRANETVWFGLTRPQWFLVPTLALMAWHLSRRTRAGAYAALRLRPRWEPA